MHRATSNLFLVLKNADGCKLVVFVRISYLDADTICASSNYSKMKKVETIRPIPRNPTESLIDLLIVDRVFTTNFKWWKMYNFHCMKLGVLLHIQTSSFSSIPITQ